MKSFLLVLLAICSSYAYSNAKAAELTAGYLRDMCNQDRTACRGILNGLKEGLKIGSIVGSVGAGRNILREQKYEELTKRMTHLFLKNKGVYLGFCKPHKKIDFVELFLNFFSRNKKEEKKHAAYVLIYALQEAYPIKNCEDPSMSG